MSDKAISVGDLVVVVKSLSGNIGKIGIVEGPAPCDVDNFNPAHGQRVWVKFSRRVSTIWGRYYNPSPFPISWLRRIPPLAELDEVERKEETPA